MKNFIMWLQVVLLGGWLPVGATVADLPRDSIGGMSAVLGDVVVYGSKNDFGIESPQMSAIDLPISQVRSVPQVFGEIDVLKSLQRLPGVQQSNDNDAGILVRGGDYDQNLITLDGATIYNAGHLKGFVSAINPDMVENLVFYKGAFPARYGERLSSVVDIGIKEGDFLKYHGSLTVGALSAKLQVGGPVWKGRTSFSVAARASYFGAIVRPVLKKVYDRPDNMQPYSGMDYYDMSAKLMHRFSDSDKLSASFYIGNDVADVSPSNSIGSGTLPLRDGSMSRNISTVESGTDNSWRNIVGSLFWTHRKGDRFVANTNFSFSSYDYNLGLYTKEIKENYWIKNLVEKLESKKITRKRVDYDSEIADASLASDFELRLNNRNSMRWGVKVSLQKLLPSISSMSEWYYYDVASETTDNEASKFVEKSNLVTASLYAEDEWTATRWLKLNAGLRNSLYVVDGKAYNSIEPRISLRVSLPMKSALKASYSMVSQGIHRLASSNVVMPSEIWVPSTKRIPLMKSHQLALGYAYEVDKDFNLSVEGYYKTFDNVVEYLDGSSYMVSDGSWEDLVAVGEGRSYGVEAFLQKKFGNTNGWVSYTWSKSLRRFDRMGMEINGGREFYSNSDRRNNFSIVVAHKFNEHWEVSGAWTYYTGRRGTLSNVTMFGGYVIEYNAHGSPVSSDSDKLGKYWSAFPDESLKFDMLMRYATFNERNNYHLPANHRLDICGSFSCRHKRFGESMVSLSVYNLYNHMNISQVYVGYDQGRTVLKGVCLFPFMPSLSYTFKF